MSDQQAAEMNTILSDFHAYAVGPVAASVCTSLTDDAATERLNAEHPTGIASRWTISNDDTFADSTTPNPSPCPVPGRGAHRHILFVC